nr:hypothetical protein [Tanacetum cinerariifolium]
MFRKECIRIESSTQHSFVNDFVVINIPEEDVEPKQIILDHDDQPIWEGAKTVASTPISAIAQLDVDDNFGINSNLVKINSMVICGPIRMTTSVNFSQSATCSNMVKLKVKLSSF